MDQKEFSGLFKDIIAHLYDYSVLETHPLVGLISPPAEFSGSRGEYIRQIVIEAIERFRPEGKEYSEHAIEWRPYHILFHRYVNGASLRELSQKYSLSERQLRRDSSRALQALTERVWVKISSLASSILTSPGQVDEDQRAFDVNLEILNLNSVIEGVVNVLSNRIKAEGYALILDFDSTTVKVMTDRIVIRQIMISLVGYILNFNCIDAIHLMVETGNSRVDMRFWSKLAEPWSKEDEIDHLDLLESAFYWGEQINTVIQESHPLQGQLGNIEITLSLPPAEQPIVLVVDDQKPTHQMFHRFLSQTVYQIVGVTDPGEVLDLARQLKPALITLDVMMPKVDGWEILQALQTDIETKDIPILVCSAWEEPELAKSLGAAGFLKKPIRQRDLLAALDRLNL
jgi:CheY-like chemotaxis protein